MPVFLIVLYKFSVMLVKIIFPKINENILFLTLTYFPLLICMFEQVVNYYCQENTFHRNLSLSWLVISIIPKMHNSTMKHVLQFCHKTLNMCIAILRMSVGNRLQHVRLGELFQLLFQVVVGKITSKYISVLSFQEIGFKKPTSYNGRLCITCR